MENFRAKWSYILKYMYAVLMLLCRSLGSEFTCGFNVLIVGEYRCYYVEISELSKVN